MPGLATPGGGGFVKTLLDTTLSPGTLNWDTLRENTGGRNFLVVLIGGGGGGRGSMGDNGDPGTNTVFDTTGVVSIVTALGGGGGGEEDEIGLYPAEDTLSNVSSSFSPGNLFGQGGAGNQGNFFPGNHGGFNEEEFINPTGTMDFIVGAGGSNGTGGGAVGIQGAIFIYKIK
jgi:hypothetical protein